MLAFLDEQRLNLSGTRAFLVERLGVNDVEQSVFAAVDYQCRHTNPGNLVDVDELIETRSFLIAWAEDSKCRHETALRDDAFDGLISRADQVQSCGRSQRGANSDDLKPEDY